MSAPAGTGAAFVKNFPVKPKQAMTVAAGVQRQKDINASNFPVKPSAPARQLGTMTFNNLKPPQAATGNHMGTTSFAGQSPKIAPKMGNSQVAGAPAFPVTPRSPGRGYSAFVDEQIGGAGMKMSTRDSKSGFVLQDGARKGQTRQEAMGGLRKEFLDKTPEERAAYDEQAEILGGSAGRPEPAAPVAAATGAAQHAAVVNRQPAGAAIAAATPPMLDDDDEDGNDEDEEEDLFE